MLISETEPLIEEKTEAKEEVKTEAKKEDGDWEDVEDDKDGKEKVVKSKTVTLE